LSQIKTPNQFIIDSLEVELKDRRGLEDKRAILDSEENEIYLELAAAEKKLREGLPHLYGYPWYEWAYDFFTTENKLAFLCAANQISKSSTQIRKIIDWATDKQKWPRLWPNKTPNQFWYLYPTINQATIEFHKKWKAEFLPRGEFKDHPVYGWREEVKAREIYAIHFNSGVTIYFKTYKQGGEALQTGSVYYVACDEEVPEGIWDELAFRVSATNGFISMVFTATLGQEMWRKTIEPRDADEELFKGAWKKQVSMYNCHKYIDGTNSPWSTERIAQVIRTCKSHQEVLRRVHGKFIKDEGLVYPQFDAKRHVTPAHILPRSWVYYMGADVGSGGEGGHPSAITLIAVDPMYRRGRVVWCWRGDGIRTTASDVYQKAENELADRGIIPLGKFYDFASAEFGEISSRNGGGWLKAEKKHDIGEGIINVLFRNNMLEIYDQYDAGKLAGELSSLSIGGSITHKKNDLIDSFRYAVTKIPWDWSVIGDKLPDGAENVRDMHEEKLTPQQLEVKQRRDAFLNPVRDDSWDIQAEFAEWNDEYG